MAGAIVVEELTTEVAPLARLWLVHPGSLLWALSPERRGNADLHDLDARRGKLGKVL
jgi:hypothetical protein